MEALNRILSRIGVDRALHLAFGGWIESKFCEAGSVTAALCGLLALLALSVLKEYKLDERPDWADIAFAMAGGVLEIVSWLLIRLVC